MFSVSTLQNLHLSEWFSLTIFFQPSRVVSLGLGRLFGMRKVSLCNSCVISWLILLLSIFIGLPCMNVHLAHFSRPNSILMSECCFTNFSCSANLLLFSVMSLKSSMCSRCVTFLVSLDALLFDGRVYPCRC